MSQVASVGTPELERHRARGNQPGGCAHLAGR